MFRKNKEMSFGSLKVRLDEYPELRRLLEDILHRFADDGGDGFARVANRVFEALLRSRPTFYDKPFCDKGAEDGVI
jgi:hypothetical protein